MNVEWDKLNAFIQEGSNLTLGVGFLGNQVHKKVDKEDKNTTAEQVGDIAHQQEFGLGVWETSFKGRDYSIRKPPRPFMRNAIAENENKWVDEFANSVANAISTDGSFKNAFDKLGKTASQDVKDSIQAIHQPPIGFVTKGKRQERGNFSDKPLIDTGQMINSVSYDITKK